MMIASDRSGEERHASLARGRIRQGHGIVPYTDLILQVGALNLPSKVAFFFDVNEMTLDAPKIKSDSPRSLSLPAIPDAQMLRCLLDQSSSPRCPRLSVKTEAPPPSVCLSYLKCPF